MRMKLSEQSPCGILDSLIARLLLEDKLDGVATLLHALNYLQTGTVSWLLTTAPGELMGALGEERIQQS